ncbi:MAG: biotin transporter BioY [Rhodospirillales bacterium]
MSAAATMPVLIDRLWHEEHPTAKLIRWGLLALAGSVLLTLSAKLRVPLEPVPVTMQTYAMLVIGAMFGPRLGAAAMLLYLAEGALGLPVFAGTPEKGAGLAYMMGPTGGYLIGGLCAVYLVGWFAERGWDREIFTCGVIMLAGVGLIYLGGVVWLGTLVGWDKPVLQWGLFPFIGADIIKAALAMATLPLAWGFLTRKKD